VKEKQDGARQNRQKTGAGISKAKINLGEMKNSTFGLLLAFFATKKFTK
jgi:hypothetical protein